MGHQCGSDYEVYKPDIASAGGDKNAKETVVKNKICVE